MMGCLGRREKGEERGGEGMGRGWGYYAMFCNVCVHHIALVRNEVASIFFFGFVHFVMDTPNICSHFDILHGIRLPLLFLFFFDLSILPWTHLTSANILIFCME